MSQFVGPARAPASCSAFHNHRRNVAFVQPMLGAITNVAAQNDA